MLVQIVSKLCHSKVGKEAIHLSPLVNFCNNQCALRCNIFKVAQLFWLCTWSHPSWMQPELMSHKEKGWNRPFALYCSFYLLCTCKSFFSYYQVDAEVSVIYMYACMLCIILVIARSTNYIWRISNLHRAFFVSWLFTVWSAVFSKLVIYVHCDSSVILFNLYGIQSALVFICFCRIWFTLWNFLLVWGSLRLAPISSLYQICTYIRTYVATYSWNQECICRREYLTPVWLIKNVIIVNWHHDWGDD